MTFNNLSHAINYKKKLLKDLVNRRVSIEREEKILLFELKQLSKRKGKTFDDCNHKILSWIKNDSYKCMLCNKTLSVNKNVWGGKE